MITPADYPQLASLIWNGDPSRALPAREIFSLYERNWRFVDREQLSQPEADLIAQLAHLFGQGVLLVS
jgi:hypothetical protein